MFMTLVSSLIEMMALKYTVTTTQLAFSKQYFKLSRRRNVFFLIHAVSGIVSTIIGTIGWIIVSLNQKLSETPKDLCKNKPLMIMFDIWCFITLINLLSSVPLIAKAPQLTGWRSIFFRALLTQMSLVTIYRMEMYYDNNTEKFINKWIAVVLSGYLLVTSTIRFIWFILCMIGITQWKVTSFDKVQREHHLSVNKKQESILSILKMIFIEPFTSMNQGLSYDTSFLMELIFLTVCVPVALTIINFEESVNTGIITPSWTNFLLGVSYMFLSLGGLIAFQMTLLVLGKVTEKRMISDFTKISWIIFVIHIFITMPIEFSVFEPMLRINGF